MSRARGANAQTALAFADTYGAVPADGFYKVAFSSLNLGEEQGLTASDLLGFGREPLPPSEAEVNNDGDITVAVDARLFGLFLKMLLGAPTTTQGVAATGSITPATNPAANDTITVGGQAFTFKVSISGANQILIGPTLADTIDNAVWALNASTVAGVKVASYSTGLDHAAILVKHDTIGTAGNAFTLAASAAAVSGSTLSGGSTSGPYNHVFTSGALSLPDVAIEIGHPDVPAFHMNYGVTANTLAIALQRTGNLNAVINLIAQGEAPATATSAAGTPTELVIDRFAQAAGAIEYAGVPLAEIVSGQMNYSNGLEKAENIRPDGRIDGVDPGMISVTPQVTARYKTRQLIALAENKTAIDLVFSWRRGATQSLTFRMPEQRLPRTRRPITGPGFIQQTYSMQGQRDAVMGKTLIATLVNDVPNYD